MKPISNKTIGNQFEEVLCNLLSEHGFWAHNMAQNQTGQPADIIAAKNDSPVLIDCKDCNKDRFPLSRIEPNQEAAMTLWEMQGNRHCYFALRLSSGIIYMVSFNQLELLSMSGKFMLNKNEIEQYPTFRDWVEGEEWK